MGSPPDDICQLRRHAPEPTPILSIRTQESSTKKKLTAAKSHGEQVFGREGKRDTMAYLAHCFRVDFKSIGLHKVRRVFKNLLPHALQ